MSNVEQNFSIASEPPPQQPSHHNNQNQSQPNNHHKQSNQNHLTAKSNCHPQPVENNAAQPTQQPISGSMNDRLSDTSLQSNVTTTTTTTTSKSSLAAPIVTSATSPLSTTNAATKAPQQLHAKVSQLAPSSKSSSHATTSETPTSPKTTTTTNDISKTVAASAAAPAKSMASINATATNVPSTITSTLPISASQAILNINANTTNTSSTTARTPSAEVVTTKHSRSRTRDTNNNNSGQNSLTNFSGNNTDDINNHGSQKIDENNRSLQQRQPQLESTQMRPSSSSTNNGGTAPRVSNNKTSDTVEPKPKSSRSRKSANTKGTNITGPPTLQSPKPEATPRRAAKNKASKVSQLVEAAAAVIPPPASVPNDKTNSESIQQTAPPTKKRKSRSASNDSNKLASSTSQQQQQLQLKQQQPQPLIQPQTTSSTRRPRKKKTDQVTKPSDPSSNPLMINPLNAPLNITNPQLLSMASNVPVGLSPNMGNIGSHQQQQQRLMPGISPLDCQDPSNRYFSLTISPLANYDCNNAASLTRPSLSRLWTSSSSIEGNRCNAYSDELSKAFEELRENTWSHLSKCILDQAQQFDIPSLIGTLYTLRAENDKLVNKVRDLNLRKEQLTAMNARLDLPGPMLNQHLSNTSPNFSSIVSNLTNSPKSLSNSSPSPAMNKSPLVPGGPYNHIPGSHLGPSGNYLDRSSPLVGIQASHPVGVNNFKSSISTPSPPIGALMAHGANSRASLMTISNPPYVSAVHHQSMTALNPLGQTTPSSSYYPRQ